MRLDDFDYHLPAESIAQFPLPRGESRLLVLDAAGEDRHRRIADLPRLLRRGDLLVVNNTRVIPARLFARRESGGRVELLLVRKVGECAWQALIKPGRKARPGVRLELPDGPGIEVLAAPERGDEGAQTFTVRFSEPVEPHLERLGHVPLPPYIRRPDQLEDRQRYQTVFARRDGAVAAPTAGLHLSEQLLAELADAGIERAEVTLHVGIGTFKPVTVEEVETHRMDAERFEVTPETAAAIQRTRAAGGRIVAVGTTVVRTLEALAAEHGEVRPGQGDTRLFIYPGFPFRAVDVLLTNFHLPRSTLLLLVSAFAGHERVLTRKPSTAATASTPTAMPCWWSGLPGAKNPEGLLGALAVAAGGYLQGPAHGGHLLRADGAYEVVKTALVHGLDLIEVDRGLMLEPFPESDQDFAGCAVDR